MLPPASRSTGPAGQPGLRPGLGGGLRPPPYGRLRRPALRARPPHPLSHPGKPLPPSPIPTNFPLPPCLFSHPPFFLPPPAKTPNKISPPPKSHPSVVKTQHHTAFPRPSPCKTTNHSPLSLCICEKSTVAKMQQVANLQQTLFAKMQQNGIMITGNPTIRYQRRN